jgi:hypothetical protein
MGDKKRGASNLFFGSSQIGIFTYLSNFNILKSMIYLDVLGESDSIIQTDI